MTERTQHTEFTVREDFKDSVYGDFYAGDKRDTAKMPDMEENKADGTSRVARAIERVDGWHQCGWVTLPDREDAPKMDPEKPVRLDPVSVQHAVSR